MHIKMQLFCVCCWGTVFIMQCTEEMNNLLFKNKILRHFAFSLRLTVMFQSCCLINFDYLMKWYVDFVYLPLKQDMKTISIYYGFWTCQKSGQLYTGDNKKSPMKEITSFTSNFGTQFCLVNYFHHCPTNTGI